MQIRLKYGEEGLELKFPETPNFVGVLHPQKAPVLADPEAAVRQSLCAPITSKPLAELAKDKRDAVIVISDITSPVPNALLLIIDQIEAAGIAPEQITILVATGIHRPNEGVELERLVGKQIAASYRIINHFSKQDEEMELVGEIGDGVPALVNRH